MVPPVQSTQLDGALAKTPLRAMGVPIVCRNRGLGISTSKYVDLFDLTQYPNRIFYGIAIENPDSSNAISIAMGAAFCGASNERIYVPAGGSFVFDALTYGTGVTDQYLALRVDKIRAALSATSGTAGSGTINYSSSGQPTAGMCVYLNGVVYEFVPSTGGSSGDGNLDVNLGGSSDASWLNLMNAVTANDQGVTAAQNTGSHILTFTSTYAGTFSQNWTTADGNKVGGNTTGATFSGANLSAGSGGTTPIVHIW